MRKGSFEDGFRNFGLSNQKTRDAVTGMQKTWGRGGGFGSFLGGHAKSEVQVQRP